MRGKEDRHQTNVRFAKTNNIMNNSAIYEIITVAPVVTLRMSQALKMPTFIIINNLMEYNINIVLLPEYDLLYLDQHYFQHQISSGRDQLVSHLTLLRLQPQDFRILAIFPSVTHQKGTMKRHKINFPQCSTELHSRSVFT